MFLCFVAMAFGSVSPEPADRLQLQIEDWLRDLDTPEEEVSEIATGLVSFETEQPWQTGTIQLQDGAVTVELDEGDRYVGPGAASDILEAWGNPPDPNTDGLLLPAGAHLFGPDSWAVVLTFEEEGWVDDSEAASIDYDELLESMQEGQLAANDERTGMGLDPVYLDGWAEPPHYDAASKVLYWALLVRGSGGNSVNYDVRVLGRRGVLSLNALAGDDQLAMVRTEMARVRNLATFQEGHRYADYVPGTDRKAAYGIAALVAGGAVVAKSGMLKGLLALLLAGKKFVIIGVIALLGGIKAMFGRGKADPYGD